jgi:hypothetical protein
MSQNTDAQNRAAQIQAKPLYSNRLGALVLTAGIALYLIVLAVGLAEIGVRPKVAAQAVSVLVVLSILFPLVGLFLFAVELVEGVVTGTPVAWYRYTLSFMRQHWMPLVGCALLAIPLLAILAAVTI